MVGNAHNPSVVSKIINDLYNMDMQSNINSVLDNFFDNIKQLYYINYSEFIKQVSIVLGSIINLNDYKLCINIIRHINDVNLKYKIVEFFSYKWLERLLNNENEEWSSEQIVFMNSFFQQLKVKDIIKIIKSFSFEYKEDFICRMFKQTFETNTSAYFMESIKQSYKKLAQEIYNMFSDILKDSKKMFLELLSFDEQIFNKSIIYLCEMFKDFIKTHILEYITNICYCKNTQISIYIVKWIVQNNKNQAINYAFLSESIKSDNPHIFKEMLKHFKHLNKWRILNLIIDYVLNNDSIILNNYLVENIFYNNEIDILFDYAKINNFQKILQILQLHYSYKIKFINNEFCMIDVDVIYKSVNSNLLKNLTVEYNQSQLECVICYNSCNRIIKLDCHNSHMYCEDCLNKWIFTHNSCPLCRSTININNAKLLFLVN